VYLFERDCSVQRRHQKVLEEAPAPGHDARRCAQRMGAAAVAAAKAVDYVGAGTVEFIAEQTGGTSAPTDAVLLHGDEHPPAGRAPGDRGHHRRWTWSSGSCAWPAASRCRCEQGESGDPWPRDRGAHLRRKPGQAASCPPPANWPCDRWPPHVAFSARARCASDDGVREGDAISPFYDSMVAKLIVQGATRAQALARLDAALAATHIVGLATNVQFLRHVVASPSFAHARLDTALIAREVDALFGQDKLGLPLTACALVASTLAAEQDAAAVPDGTGWTDPRARRDGWNVFGISERRFALRFRGEADTRQLLRSAPVACRWWCKAAARHCISAYTRWRAGPGGRPAACGGWVYRQGAVHHVFTDQGAAEITAVDLPAHAGASHAEGGRLTAPMPGKVVSFAVRPGDVVAKGQALAVMEAMKMEHTITAPADGAVAELLFAPGDQVAEGAELLRLQPVRPSRTMRITFRCADTSAPEWLVGLRAALPQAEVSLWHRGVPVADYAVVWALPQAFFDEQTRLKAVFNTGAGVDALLRLRLPAGVRIVRLDDAGMAGQMAGYVCHALLGYTRGFARYAQQAERAQWAQHEALDLRSARWAFWGLGALGERVARTVRRSEFSQRLEPQPQAPARRDSFAAHRSCRFSRPAGRRCACCRRRPTPATC